MIKKVTVERWITTDGASFDAKDAAERHETACLLRNCLEAACGDPQACFDWENAIGALLSSPSFTITRVGGAV